MKCTRTCKCVFCVHTFHPPKGAEADVLDTSALFAFGDKDGRILCVCLFLLIQPFPVARKELNKGSRWESGAGALLYVRRCGKAIALAEREGAAAVIRMSQKTYRKA